MRWGWVVLTVLPAVALGCGGREGTPAQRDPSEEVRRRLAEDVKAGPGCSLNDQSPETVGTLSPRLRVGMTYAELNRILAEKNSADPKTGKHVGTLVFGRGIVWLQDKAGKPLRDDKGELRPDPDRWYCVLHVRDADLKVIFDKEERLVSWSVEPLPPR